LEEGLGAAHQAFEELQGAGISFQEVTEQLEAEGVKSFADAFTTLLNTVEKRRLAAVSG
jgi:hypothetical protein